MVTTGPLELRKQNEPKLFDFIVSIAKVRVIYEK